jgi:hypothetical protein
VYVAVVVQYLCSPSYQPLPCGYVILPLPASSPMCMLPLQQQQQQQQQYTLRLSKTRQCVYQSCLVTHAERVHVNVQTTLLSYTGCCRELLSSVKCAKLHCYNRPCTATGALATAACLVHYNFRAPSALASTLRTHLYSTPSA